MPGVIETINTSPAHGTPQSSVEKAQLTAGVGLEGDRYANADGGVVSIIEAEQVEAFNDATGLGIDASVTGRNIVTRGAELNPLVGKQFKLGDVTLECFELCEPCASLAARLSTDTVSAAEVVKAFTHSAGIRARVVSSGAIAPGTTLGDQ